MISFCAADRGRRKNAGDSRLQRDRRRRVGETAASHAVTNLGQSLLRGNYMRAEAWMRHWGIPIDKPLADDMATHWDDLRGEIITDLNTRYPFFEGSVFKKKLLERWIVEHGIQYWPRTPTGQICHRQGDASSHCGAMSQR